MTPLNFSFHCYTNPCTRVCKPAGGEGYGGWDCGVGEAVGGEGFGVGVALTPPPPPTQDPLRLSPTIPCILAHACANA